MANPTPKPTLNGALGVNPQPRMTGGISGPGGKNVTKDYKETSTQKNLWQKIQHTFREKPVESSESLRYNKELRNKNK